MANSWTLVRPGATMARKTEAMKETTKVLARPENYGTADPDLAIGAAIVVVVSAQTEGG